MVKMLKTVHTLSGFLLAGSAALTSVIFIGVRSDQRTSEIRALRTDARVFFMHIQAAERMQRGYVLTEDPAYLDHFYDHEKEIQPSSALVFHKFEEMKRTINLTKDGRRDEAIELIRTNDGLNYMTQIEDDNTALIATLAKEESVTEELRFYWKNMALLLSVMITTLTAIVLSNILKAYNARLATTGVVGDSA